MSLMASSSSFPPRNYNFNVFTSFHGPDVRKTLLSHMHEQFKRNGITMFDDQKIERSATIAPSLTEAIQESRISIVILSKKYASSSWCLDELVEILESKKYMGQIVMTIFYGVDPSDVRNQIGEFGVAFDETCARKPYEYRQKWSKALNEVGNIAGEDFLRWDNEANMIKKIAKDVSDKLNATPSRDFDDMVGLEAHLREMKSLLDFDYDGVKMVGITGPAGIGKTTIARALQSRVSNQFQLICFMDNLRESYPIGLDEYGLKLRLQEQFLSKLFNQNGMRICHLGVIEERLCKQRVLIILDDVNNINQLRALANDTSWFGPGSRIVVTTENKELLQQHGINNTYHVEFPSREEALGILCGYAFKQNSPPHGFKELSERITELCGRLPLGLRVVGSSLRNNMDQADWEDVLNRLETSLTQDIKGVLRVGYGCLDEYEKMLFLHIAVFFNGTDGDLVKAMFSDNKLAVRRGLNILEERSLIDISTYGKEIVMHRLLQQMGQQMKEELLNHGILTKASEICDVLEYSKGTRAVSGISFDTSGIIELYISNEAFKRMPNLQFLRVYKSKDDGNDILNIPEEMDFPCRLRLLHWEAYPSKCLPPSFHPEYLVELSMPHSKLEKLWEGTQLLTNLKKIDLDVSLNLKELPDLSNATNLESMNLNSCKSLVEIPSSCLHLRKLQFLIMYNCQNLEVIPVHMNLASLEKVYMGGCSRLRNVPVMSTNITTLYITDAAVEHVPPSISLCSRLHFLTINGCGNFKGLTHLPPHIRDINLSDTDIERIPDCIKDLHLLETLRLVRCRRLASLPELPSSLRFLHALDCESLETVSFPLNVSDIIDFANCFKLCKQARRATIQHSFHRSKTILPGKEVPAEFDHRGRGNSLIIPPDVNRPYRRFVVCVVISHNQQEDDFSDVWRRPIHIRDLDPIDGVIFVDSYSVPIYRREHLIIFGSLSPFKEPSEVSREMVFKFSSELHNHEIIECGAKILTYQTDRSYNVGSDDEDCGYYNQHTYEYDEMSNKDNDGEGYTSESEEAYKSESGETSVIDQMFENDNIEFESSEASEDDTEYGDPANGVICHFKEGEKHTDCWSWLPFLCFGLSDCVRNVGSSVSGRRR